ncbi:hypothetical protein Q5H92_10435 [Hymenobacter sp. M29]|uniref:Uncharacterized protein n=1 Tax=Hymenobacter mellowenesis TaxID=3063995 RepID=A0ABT9AAC2_9BACT|nr:hypothetical protein [Hymenobacter sp. M29]MDO7846775.1 hypothetical protein [Hymenobacter sp. M29]
MGKALGNTRTPLITAIFASAASLALATQLAFTAPAPAGLLLTKDFSWQQPNRSILQPAFSHSGRELAFVQQFHIPDGDESEQREGVAESRLAKVASNQRLADPVVSILHIATQRIDSVDYGWDPSFSPGDSLLAYAYQHTPISGKRVLAETLKGNSIRVYERRARKRVTIALPKQGYLLQPAFANPNTLWYQQGNAINGSYGGGTGISQYNLRSKRDSVVEAPQKHYGYFNIIGSFHPVPRGLAYVVWQAADKGFESNWMANEYDASLKSRSGLLHQFKKMPFKNVDSRVAITSTGDVVYLDDQHSLRKEKNYFYQYHGAVIVSRKLFPEEYHEAYLSPNGRYALVCTYENTAYLLDIATLKKTPMELPVDTEVFNAVWSDTSERLVVVQSTSGASQDTDVLSVFTIH